MTSPAIIAPIPNPITVPIPGKRSDPMTEPAAAISVITLIKPPPFSDELFIINILSSRFFNT